MRSRLVLASLVVCALPLQGSAPAGAPQQTSGTPKAPWRELFVGRKEFGFVTGVHWNKGKLFFFDSPVPASADGGDVHIWDFEARKARRVLQVQEQGVMTLREIAGNLYIPGPDAMESWDLGNFYLSRDSGETWQKVRTIPVGVHIWDMCSWRGKLYVSTGSVRNGEGYGAVCESSDGGQTWTESLIADPPDRKGKKQFGRCYALIPTSVALYASFSAYDETKLIDIPERNWYRFDGKSWTPAKPFPERVATPFFGLRHREIRGIAFVLGRPNSYILRNGKPGKLTGLESLTAFAVAVRGDAVYAVASALDGKPSCIYRASFSGLLEERSRFEKAWGLAAGEEGIALEVVRDTLYCGTRRQGGGRLLAMDLASPAVTP